MAQQQQYAFARVGGGAATTVAGALARGRQRLTEAGGRRARAVAAAVLVRAGRARGATQRWRQAARASLRASAARQLNRSRAAAREAKIPAASSSAWPLGP